MVATNETGHTSPGVELARESGQACVLEVREVTMAYKVGSQQVVALKDVSLTIDQGEFVAITGTSGCGKSTLLHLMGGLDRPKTGDILVNGVSLSDMSDRKLSMFRNKTIGFVFQAFYLQPFLNVQMNVEVPAMFARTKLDKRSAASEQLISVVGLKERALHRPGELSGGQMQRAAIARALENNPSILLADEPTGNLDRANALAIFDLFRSICREQGTTVVIVTHDGELAAKADRVIRMSDGVVL